MPEQEASGGLRKRYKTDLTDAEWNLIGDLFPPVVAKTGFAPTDLREVMNTIRYQNRTGCPWDLLPHDLCAKSTAFGYYRAWQDSGLWQQLLDALRAQVRLATPRPTPPAHVPAPVDPVEPPARPPQTLQEPPAFPQATPVEPPPLTYREETPSLVLMDSQSAKTTEVGGEQRGYDGGKKVKGRKRHIAVDTLGLLLAVVVTAANVSDSRGACQLLERLPPKRYPRLRVVCGDGRYHDTCLVAAVARRGLELEVKSRPPGAKGFVVIKQRWVVERTFAWLGFNRRLSKDYERTVASSETQVRIAAIGMMLRRLTAHEK